MSLINRLFQKPSADAEASRPSAISTRPGGAGETGGDRKAERSEHREQLYAVVREAMTRAGVLSSSYKFKVLSLDSRGSNFLIMMDLVSSAAEESSRLAEIEALVMHNSKVRHNLIVAAMYWRLSDYVTTGLQSKSANGQAARGVVQENVRDQAVAVEEMLAFKKAFAGVSSAGPLSASGEVMRSGRRNPQPLARETDADGDDVRASPLGPTQYGELN